VLRGIIQEAARLAFCVVVAYFLSGRTRSGEDLSVDPGGFSGQIRFRQALWTLDLDARRSSERGGAGSGTPLDGLPEFHHGLAKWIRGFTVENAGNIQILPCPSGGPGSCSPGVTSVNIAAGPLGWTPLLVAVAQRPSAPVVCRIALRLALTDGGELKFVVEQGPPQECRPRFEFSLASEQEALTAAPLPSSSLGPSSTPADASNKPFHLETLYAELVRGTATTLRLAGQAPGAALWRGLEDPSLPASELDVATLLEETKLTAGRHTCPIPAMPNVVLASEGAPFWIDEIAIAENGRDLVARVRDVQNPRFSNVDCGKAVRARDLGELAAFFGGAFGVTETVLRILQRLKRRRDDGGE
jgi:hypothetical protein